MTGSFKILTYFSILIILFSFNIPQPKEYRRRCSINTLMWLSAVNNCPNNCRYKILRASILVVIRVIDISKIHLRFYYNFSKKKKKTSFYYGFGNNSFTILTLLRKTYCHEFKLNPYLKINQNKLLLIKVLIYLKYI